MLLTSLHKNPLFFLFPINYEDSPTPLITEKKVRLRGHANVPAIFFEVMSKNIFGQSLYIQIQTTSGRSFFEISPVIEIFGLKPKISERSPKLAWEHRKQKTPGTA